MVLTFMTVKDEKIKVPARNITCFKLWALIREPQMINVGINLLGFT